MKCSFVIPVFNEQDTLAALVEGIANHAPATFEIIFVDDGSTDGSAQVLKQIAQENDSVRVVSFAMNRGKSEALSRGFAEASGDVIFMMDADLQDDPKEIPRFLAKFEEGFDVVSGWKAIRHDPWHKTLPSKVYNGIVRAAFGLPIHDINCGFKLFKAETAKSLLIYGDRHRVLPVLAAAAGYRVAEIPVEHHPRRHGTSKYGVSRLFTGAVDLAAVYFILRYRHKPAQFFAKFGAILAILGLCLNWQFANMLPIMIALIAGGIASFAAGLVCELMVFLEEEKSRALSRRED